MIVEMLEAAADCAFPYNADALEATALNLGKAAYGAKFCLGDNGKWRRGFERRHKHRIDKVKSSSICSRRAAAATKEVRDAVFGRFVYFSTTWCKQVVSLSNSETISVTTSSMVTK